MKLDARRDHRRSAIDAIRERLLDFDDIADIKLPGLPADRRPVIAGGLLILDAAFAELGIERMQVSDYALREGVLLRHARPRQRARPARRLDRARCAERYGVDTDAGRARRSAPRWRCSTRSRPTGSSTPTTAACWPGPRASTRSAWRSRTASTTSTAPTWSSTPTSPASRAASSSCSPRWCATSAAALSLDSFDALPDRLAQAALHCALLLRLAVLLHRSHSREDIPWHSLKASNGTLELALPENWLAAHPLTAGRPRHRGRLPAATSSAGWRSWS